MRELVVDLSDGTAETTGLGAVEVTVDHITTGVAAEIDSPNVSIGVPGQQGEDGDSAYQVALDNGFVGTEEEWLASLQGEDGFIGADGDSAYEVAVDNGFTGTEEEWLASLQGEQGPPTFPFVQPNEPPAGEPDGTLWIDTDDLDVLGEVVTGGTPGQVYTKQSTDDYDADWEDLPDGLPTGGSTGQYLTKNSGTSGDAGWSTLPVQVKDSRWVVPAGVTSVDEFNDAALDSAWVRVEAAGTASRVTWTERGDVLSFAHTGSDTAAQLHALLRPFVLPIGGYIETCMKAVWGWTGSPMLGALVTDGTTPGSGTQACGGMWYDTIGFGNYNVRTVTGFGTSGVDGAVVAPWPSTNTTRIAALGLTPFFSRILRTASQTYQSQASADGVSWVTTTQITTGPAAPTHIGVFCTSWASTAPFMGTFEYLRRG